MKAEISSTLYAAFENKIKWRYMYFMVTELLLCSCMVMRLNVCKYNRNPLCIRP